MRICRSCCIPPTTITGHVKGCTGALPVSGMTVVLTAPGPVTLGTGTTDGTGAYSIGITIGSTTTVTATATPASARFATTSNSASVTVGGSHGIDVTLNPATDYHCVAGCNYPVYKTLTVIDSLWGTFTETWTGSLWSSGEQTLVYPGYAPSFCAATSLLITYQMAPGGPTLPNFNGLYWVLALSGSGACPRGTHTSSSNVAWTGGTSSITTCPGASTAPTFVAKYRMDLAVLNLGTPYFITVQE
jgi:hypothetical protein